MRVEEEALLVKGLRPLALALMLEWPLLVKRVYQRVLLSYSERRVGREVLQRL